LDKRRTLNTFNILWFSIRHYPLTPSPQDQKLGPDHSIEHDARSLKRAGIPMRVQVLPRLWDIWMHGDPRTGEYGDETTPDDIQNRSAIARVCATGQRTIFRDCWSWYRRCEDLLERIDGSEKEQHIGAEGVPGTYL
jgi:hypothetical protein